MLKIKKLQNVKGLYEELVDNSINITIKGSFWFCSFTEILKSYFSSIKILSLNNYSVAWNEKKLQKGKGLLWRAYW